MKVSVLMKQKASRRLCVLLCAVFLLMFLPRSVQAALSDEIVAREQQIQDIQRQIDDYQRQIDENQSKSLTLQGEISKLNAKIGQITLQIKSLGVSIDQSSLEIQDTQAQIIDAEQKIIKHRDALAQYIRVTYSNDRRDLTEILLKHQTLSDFFGDLNNLQVTQDTIRGAIDVIKQLREDLANRQEYLETKKAELEQLKHFQESEKKNLDVNKSEKNKILKDTKGQESKFQELVKKSKLDIQRLKSQITYLQQNGISVEDAVKYGQLAAIRAGIRPAFLLAILEIESRVGQNVGTGNWNDDMYQCYLRLSKIARTPERRQYYVNRAETEKNAFFAIIGNLGLNAESVKVSREPSYGCGGALGPAQFIPSTWLGYAAKVTELTGHNPPNPWSIEDAFMASAIKLANAGAAAKTRAAESGAARAYIGGKTTCTSGICNYYANAVLNKAADIEQNL